MKSESVTEATVDTTVATAAEAPKPTLPRRAILDFDLTLAQHDAAEAGYAVELADSLGNPWYNPDGTRSVLVFAGSTADDTRAAVASISLEQRNNAPRDADGNLRPLTEKEHAKKWEDLLRAKYIATTRAADIWRKNGDGHYHRIPLTPEIVQKLFKANPHFVDLCWQEEVRRSLTFRAGTAIAPEPGEVARGDAAPSVQPDRAADAGEQPVAAQQNG